VLEHAHEGVLLDVNAVADVSQTSRRTIFRLFTDLQKMRNEALCEGLASRSITPTEDAIPSFVTISAEKFERLGPLLIFGPEEVADWQRRLIHEHFGSELFALQEHAIAAMSGWRAWVTLRTERGCTESQAKRVLEIALRRLLR